MVTNTFDVSTVVTGLSADVVTNTSKVSVGTGEDVRLVTDVEMSFQEEGRSPQICTVRHCVTSKNPK